MDKQIIATWGLGPSYRDRVKENFAKSLSMGYSNTMDYVILTDVPSDFDELRSRTNKIVDVVNIHEVGENTHGRKNLNLYRPIKKLTEKIIGMLCGKSSSFLIL